MRVNVYLTDEEQELLDIVKERYENYIETANESDSMDERDDLVERLNDDDDYINLISLLFQRYNPQSNDEVTLFEEDFIDSYIMEI